MSINIILNYILIPKYGALGSAQVCLITQSVFAGFCIIGAYLSKAFNWRDFPLVRFAIFLIVGVGFFSSGLQIGDSLLVGLFSSVLVGLTGFLLLFHPGKLWITFEK